MFASIPPVCVTFDIGVEFLGDSGLDLILQCACQTEDLMMR